MEAHPEHDWEKVVLALFKTEEEAYKWEALVVGERHLNDPLCLNLCPGGRSCVDQNQTSLITRENIKNSYEEMILSGEIPNRTELWFSNHDLKQVVRVKVSPRFLNIAQELLGRGWNCCKIHCYSKIKLSSLDINKFDSVKNAFLKNELCPTSSFSMNFYEQMYISIAVKENRVFPDYVTELYRGGWTFGRRGNKRIKLEEALNKRA